jgi:hypothetical protein
MGYVEHSRCTLSTRGYVWCCAASMFVFRFVSCLTSRLPKELRTLGLDHEDRVTLPRAPHTLEIIMLYDFYFTFAAV